MLSLPASGKTSSSFGAACHQSVSFSLVAPLTAWAVLFKAIIKTIRQGKSQSAGR